MAHAGFEDDFQVVLFGDLERKFAFVVGLSIEKLFAGGIENPDDAFVHFDAVRVFAFDENRVALDPGEDVHPVG
jgi:hypothetical protein